MEHVQEPSFRDGGRHGESLTATDIKERLIQDDDAETLLLWPPNLFAFTSFVLNLSGAYQLVVSPPPGPEKNLYHWPPKRELLTALFERSRSVEAPRDGIGLDIERELDCAERAVTQINTMQDADSPEEIWTYLVRSSALEWRTMFDGMTPAAWSEYRKQIPVALTAGRCRTARCHLERRRCWRARTWNSSRPVARQRLSKSGERCMVCFTFDCYERAPQAHLSVPRCSNSLNAG